MFTSFARLTTVAAAAALLTVLAACSGTTTPTSTSSAAVGGPIAADVPSMDSLYKGFEAAPPASSPPVTPGKSIWWISCGQSVPDCATKADEGRQATAALKWDFHLVDGALGVGGAYSAAIRTAVAAKADAIVLDAFPCQDVQAALSEAKAANVRVLGMENLDCSDTGGPSLLSAPMEYNKDATGQPEWWKAFGRYSADYIIRATNGQAKVINNPGQNAQQQFLDQGFKDELAKCPGCQIVDTASWSTADFVPNGPWIAAFRSSLIRHPEANAVYAPFDSMAAGLGGSQAIRESGRTICSGPPPFSGDCMVAAGGLGTKETLDLIRNGQWTAATSARSDTWIAWAAVDSLNRAFNGQPATPEGVGMLAIDKTHGLPAAPGSGYETSVDFRAAYLKAWGASAQ